MNIRIFFGYEMKFLLIWDLNKFSGLEFFCSPTIYLSFLINFLYFFILLIYLEQKTF